MEMQSTPNELMVMKTNIIIDFAQSFWLKRSGTGRTDGAIDVIIKANDVSRNLDV
jgi:hypothetical protein